MRSNKISHADILDVVDGEKAEILFIIGRISAYWRSSGDIEKLVDALNKTPRNLVVVDFFNAQHLEGSRELGNLEFSDILELESTQADKSSAESVAVLLATVQGSYTVNNRDYPYAERRAFYYPDHVSHYLKKYLHAYDVAVEPPIVEGDPGFTMVLRSKLSE